MFSRTWRAACCAVLAAGLAHAQTADKAAAVVNGVPISVGEVDAELRDAPLGAPAADGQQRVRRMEALGLLIDKMLLRQFLDKQLGPVAPDEMNKKLVEFEASLLRRDRKMSLHDFCQDTNQTADQVKAGLCDHLRWNAFAGAHLTDAHLEQYYKDNRDHFDKVTVRASHVALRVGPKATPEEKERLRAKLLDAQRRLAAEPGCDFAELARQLSTGPQAARGGDVGYFPRKWVMDEAFARAAFALPVGGVSDVVVTPYGLHLIKVTDRRPGEPTEFQQIKAAVRAFCSEDMRQMVLDEQRKAAAAAITIDLP
ncbi:MAG: peptidylprolyl isomerase [Gemmataceae bacterium]